VTVALQYQKQLKLLEVRRLMKRRCERDRGSVHNPSQFSREFARMFSTPPKRDVGR
jgi:hypothetical protein